MIKEEELVSEVDVTGIWEENYPHIYAVVISMTINFEQSSLAQHLPKRMDICQGIFPDLSF